MDIRTVLKMFHHLHANQPSNEWESWKTQLKQEINSDVNVTIESYEQKINKLEADLMNSDRKMKLMQDVVVRQNSVIDDISKRLDTMELNQARRMAILIGLKTQGSKQGQEEVCVRIHSNRARSILQDR